MNQIDWDILVRIVIFVIFGLQMVISIYAVLTYFLHRKSNQLIQLIADQGERRAPWDELTKAREEAREWREKYYQREGI